MKKTDILNSEISEVIAKMGHTDMLAIADSGLPIPKDVRRIDIALTKNIPSFIDTLKVVLSELCVEEIIIADEIMEKNNKVYEQIQNIMGNIKVSTMPHEEFKKQLIKCRAVIRTGEHSPYANIILKSGVTF